MFSLAHEQKCTLLEKLKVVAKHLASGFLNTQVTMAYYVTGLRAAQNITCITYCQGAKVQGKPTYV